ncbi:MAG: hypothetical protein R3C56_29005 [Pirellulaceae bacterium]
MTDASEAVRNACLSALGRFGREVAIPIYVGYLGGKDVAQINSAAYGLRQLQAKGIFFPLLNALTTKQLQAGRSWDQCKSHERHLLDRRQQADRGRSSESRSAQYVVGNDGAIVRL